MMILSHRGYWREASERNSQEAFDRSLRHGFGIELDVRDHRGALVVSHNPPADDSPRFSDVVRMKREVGGGPIAINIKADGLQGALVDLLGDLAPSDYFCFDMSVPDALGYRRAGIRFFTRHSEYEASPSLYGDAAGVWLDCFESEWFDERVVHAHLQAGKAVALVSPELHGRPHETAWDAWARWPAIKGGDVMICTDRPVECTEAFA